LNLSSYFLKNNFIQTTQFVLPTKIAKRCEQKKIMYTLSFTSLISPTSISKTRLLFTGLSNQNQKKLLLKQSYLLLTWFSYLVRGTRDTKSFGQKNTKPVLSFRPTKKTVFTLTKAPMAHKTFSQEQFIFKFYKINIHFRILSEFQATINQSIYLLLLLRKSLPITETNLLFLTRFTLTLVGSDKLFFKKVILN